MSGKYEFVQHFDDLLVCAICSDTFISPKKLPCHHTFCFKCLEVYAKHGRPEGKLCCPLCRNETVLKGSIQDLPDNKLFLSLIDVKNCVRALLAKYDWTACSVDSCGNSEGWHCTVCDVGYCKTCVSGHDKSHQVTKLETFVEYCFASAVDNQLRLAEKQLKEREADFRTAVSAAEGAICKKSEELKLLVDQHKQQLLDELNLKKLDHLRELNDLRKEIGNLRVLSKDATATANEEAIELVGTLKKHDSSLPFKLPDFGRNDVKFIPRNIHQELLSLGSLSNILGKLTLAEQQFSDVESSNLKGKIDSEVYTVGSKRGGVIVGVAALGEKIYVVHSLVSCIDEYSHEHFKLLNSLTIPGLSSPQDMAACERFGCLYVTDSYDDSVYRIEAIAGKTTLKWSMGDQPLGVSVSSTTANVFVTCLYAQKLYEFTSAGDVVQCIVLRPDVTHPHHALQVASGKIVLSHGFWSTDPLHRICVVDSDGRACQQYGNEPGSETGQVNQPVHLATYKNGFVLVADSENCRIQLLDSSLSHLICITDSLRQMKSPHRLCLDARHGLLYAAENTLQNRIFVFKLNKILS